MTVRIGTSGFLYEHWRGNFYPPASRGAELEYYATRFDLVELNVTFYRMPSGATFQAWANRVPDGFTFAVKASRYLTHIRRLKDPAEPVAFLLERIRELGPHLGPVLIQLPPDMPIDLEGMARTLDAFPPTIRVAVEPRNASWFCEPFRRVLIDHGAALCLADRRGRITPSGGPPIGRTCASTRVELHPHLATAQPPWRRGPPLSDPGGAQTRTRMRSSTTTIALVRSGTRPSSPDRSSTRVSRCIGSPISGIPYSPSSSPAGHERWWAHDSECLPPRQVEILSAPSRKDGLRFGPRRRARIRVGGSPSCFTPRLQSSLSRGVQPGTDESARWASWLDTDPPEIGWGYQGTHATHLRFDQDFLRWSPRSPWPGFATVLACCWRSAASERPTSAWSPVNLP